MEAALVLLPLTLLVGLLWLLPIRLRQDDRYSRRLSAIERRMQLIMDHLGIAEPAHPMPDVVRHLEAGKKIQAIKAYRDATGVGLKEAKDAVEQLTAQRGL